MTDLAEYGVKLADAQTGTEETGGTEENWNRLKLGCKE